MAESRKRKVSQTELIMDPPPPKRAQETTLERVADDIDGAAHARMDELVLAIIAIEEISSPPLTYLLMLIVQNSEGKLDSIYSNISQAKALLEEHPTLKDALKEAWNQRSFKEIRNLSMSCIILPWQIGSNVDTEVLRLPPIALGVVASRRYSATLTPSLLVQVKPAL
jgi:hypothetical protein